MGEELWGKDKDHLGVRGSSGSCHSGEWLTVGSRPTTGRDPRGPQCVLPKMGSQASRKLYLV